MKILIAFFISLSAMASNWVPVDKIQSQSAQAYQLESSCPGECLDIGNDPEALTAGFISLEDFYLKQSESSCSDSSDCDAKFVALVCPANDWTKIKNLELLQVYCVKLAGKKIVLDESGFNAYKAQRQLIQQQAAALLAAKKLRECGQGVMDLVLVRNAAKQPALTTIQVKQVVATYAAIKGLLETGSLNSAKEEVQAIQPDGTLVTVADKSAVISAIDSCLGN